jgi:hypothetical protein
MEALGTLVDSYRATNRVMSVVILAFGAFTLYTLVSHTSNRTIPVGTNNKHAASANPHPAAANTIVK